MFKDVLSIKEAFLEYKDVSFSKSRKSDFIKGVNRFGKKIQISFFICFWWK